MISEGYWPFVKQQPYSKTIMIVTIVLGIQKRFLAWRALKQVTVNLKKA